MSSPPESQRVSVPRDRDDDYTREAAEGRRAFLAERTGASLEHVGSYSFDPHVLPGNIEHFTGVAQVPIGIAGPLLVDGEHAQGEFYVPMATAEGTLVASYNRGMKLLHAAGGVTHDDPRRPHAAGAVVPVPLGPRGARLRRVAGRELRADPRRRRGDHAVGQAAGHRAVSGRAHPLHPLQLHDRRRRGPEPHRQGDAGRVPLDPRSLQAGRRAVLPRVELRDRQEELADQHAAHPRQARGRGGDHPRRAAARAHEHLDRAACTARGRCPTSAASCRASTTTARTRPTASPRCSSPPARTSPTWPSPRPRFVYAEQRANGDYYYSVTIPSLIVGTYGGGTSLPTQRECLELLGCYGTGKVRKLAEIVAATVLCGELSLGSAIVAQEWVDAHDLYGRNRK